MKKIDILDITGKKVGETELDASIFDGRISPSLMKQAVVAFLSNQRAGLASAKTRGEISGGGRKPWKQKGTGRARVGSTRSPLWRKGGVTFGPKPHSFHKDLPQRMKLLSLKSALNAKLKDGEIIVLDKFEIDSAKTKDFFEILKKLKLNNISTKVVVNTINQNIKLASRNIKKIQVKDAQNINTYEALNCKKILFTTEALLKVGERIKKWLN